MAATAQRKRYLLLGAPQLFSCFRVGSATKAGEAQLSSDRGNAGSWGLYRGISRSWLSAISLSLSLSAVVWQLHHLRVLSVSPFARASRNKMDGCSDGFEKQSFFFFFTGGWAG